MIATGADRLLSGAIALPPGARIGFLGHQAGVAADLQPTYWHVAKRFRLTALFAPEHGLWATHQDMEAVPDQSDAATGLSVSSLYGRTADSVRLDPQALAGVDVLLVDLQDIGTRYYTFVYSLFHAMEACAARGIPLFVLDRPNPLGGAVLEGNLVQLGYESFVGRFPWPVRHGLTMGELALWIRRQRGLDLDLHIVALQGWPRDQLFAQTGLTWVAPSPNMVSPDTALVYPGMCLLEGTNVSEGRGTTHPFEWFGAPWVDPARLVSRLQAGGLPGVAFRPLYFRPVFHKFAGQVCGGAQVHLSDRHAVRAVRLGLAVLAALHDLWPTQFDWRREPYEFVTDRPAIDLLAGGPRWRQAIEQGVSVDELEAEAAVERRPFEAQCSAHRLYR